MVIKKKKQKKQLETMGQTLEENPLKKNFTVARFFNLIFDGAELRIFCKSPTSAVKMVATMKFHTLLVAKIEDLSPVNQHLKKIGNQLSSSLKPHGATNYECTIASDHFSFSPKYEKNG